MTVSTTSSTATFYGSGGTGPFTFNFRFFQNSDIIVTRTTRGISTTLTEIVDYTLTGAGSYSGGSITLVSALLGGTPAEILTVRRSLPLTQDTSIRNQSAFFASIHEDVFDRLTMEIQQVNDRAHTSSVIVGPTAVTAAPVISGDASAGDISVDLIGYTFAIISKGDATANKVNIIDSSGATFEGLAQYRDGLQGYRETVMLVKFALSGGGYDWGRIQ